MPAALALLAAARVHGDRERAARFGAFDARSGGDHHKAKIVARARRARRNRRRAPKSSLLPAATSRCARPGAASPAPSAPRPARRGFASTWPRARGVRNVGQRVAPHADEDRRIVGVHDPPCLLGGERQDRRHQAEQRVADRMERRLRRAPRMARARGVYRRSLSASR